MITEAITDLRKELGEAGHLSSVILFWFCVLALNSLVTGLHYAQIPLALSQTALGKPGPKWLIPSGQGPEKEKERGWK